MSEPLAILDLLGTWAKRTPNAPALLAPSREPMAYAALYEQTKAVASQLRAAGVRRDGRVAIVHPNGPELAAAFLAVSAAGVAAPLNPAYRMSELDFYVSDLRATRLLTPRPASPEQRLFTERRANLDLIELEKTAGGPAGTITLSRRGSWRRERPQPGDPALVLHTSGTTSRPKLVPLTQEQLVRSARNVARTLELTSADRCLNVMPLFHIHGLVGALLASLSVGGSVVCAPDFRAPSFFDWLAELEPTWYTAVPTMHQAVLARAPAGGARDTSLRFIRSSSAPLAPHVFSALESTFGVPVIEAYGMTEAAHQMTSNPLPPSARKPGAVGLPTGIEVAVLDAAGRRLAADETGEVVIRGETVFEGYEANPEANAESFTGGWFRTGDEGSLDEDGYLSIRGRTKEIINRGGEKVSPAEVEDALLRHPDVEQAASFAIPDERLGEAVGAAVVVREGSTVGERDLQELVAERLADFKVPGAVSFVEEIPKGPTGKVQRLGLAEQLGITESPRAPALAEYAEPRSPLEHEVAELWATTLGVERVGLHDDFFALGGDSILGAEVMAQLAERTGRRPPLTTLMWAPTLAEFAELLEDGRWDDDSRIVPVRATGSRPPLFVTHALGDEVLNIGVLKRTLSEEQPLYAFRIVPHRFSYRSVEEMARDYLAEIRAVRPSGPYYLASMCSGSAIVAELMRQAHAEGDDVALAAVIDPRADFGRSAPLHYLHYAIVHLRDGSFLFAVRRKLRHWVAHVMPDRYPDPELETNPLGPTLYSLRRHYRLRPVPGTLTVISTKDYELSRAFWEERADRVDWHEVEAPHLTIFQQPHADVLGETLAEVLQESTA